MLAVFYKVQTVYLKLIRTKLMLVFCIIWNNIVSAFVFVGGVSIWLERFGFQNLAFNLARKRRFEENNLGTTVLQDMIYF